MEKPAPSRGESGTRLFLISQFWLFYSKRKRRRQVDPEDKENDSSDDTMIKNYCSFGRIYSRQSSPFNTVDSIVNFGIKHEASDDGSDIEPKTLTTQ